MTIRVTTLDNGLRVATDTMETVESVSCGLWINGGTRHEHPDDHGVAHLLEHMAFKGTRRRTAQAIAEEIEAVGGHMNAYTTRENTAYYAKVMHEDVPLAVDLLADMLQHSLFDPDELARERQVVIQEIGQAVDTPDDIIFDHFQATAWAGHPLGRPVLGTAESVRGLSRDRLTGYWHRHYAAPAMVFAAAGRIRHEEAVDLATRAFADLPTAAPAVEEAVAYDPGDYREERDLEQVHLILGFPGQGFRDADYYAGSVFSTLLGGGMSSRLFQEVRERRGLAYSVYAFSANHSDSGLFGIYAGTGPEDLPELVPVLCDELARCTDDVTEAEVARARSQLRAGVLMAQESTSARCEQLGQQMLVFGHPIDPGDMVARVMAVDVEDVRTMARRVLAAGPTVAAIGPLAQLESYDRVAARLA